MCLLCVVHVAQCATRGAYGATMDYVLCVVQGEQSVSMWCLLHNLCCVLGSLKFELIGSLIILIQLTLMLMELSSYLVMLSTMLKWSDDMAH